MRQPGSRSTALLVAAVLLHACSDGDDPVAPPTDVADPALAIVDASTEGNPGVLFLPPLRPLGPRNGSFDPSVPLRVEIGLRGSGAVESHSVADGGVAVLGDHYALDWRVPEGAEPGDVFEIRAFALTLELARVDVEVAADGRDMVRIRQAGEDAAVLDVPRTLPLRLWVNTQAVSFAQEAAEGSLEEEPGVIDADVQVLSNATGGSATVFDTEDPDAPLAGELSVEAGDVVDANGDPVDDYVLTLIHLPRDAKPSDDVPAGQQFPFVLRATITDAEGNPLFFQGGASLVLCQPADMETNQQAPYYLPAVQAMQQQIIKVDDGATVALPTTYGAPECEGHQAPGPVGLDQALSLDGLARLARRGLGRLARVLVAEPLRAGHGGLTTIRSILDLSEFAGALLTDPAASTATVPDGTVGAPTQITVQAMVTASVPQTAGGDLVVVEVSGANAATLTVGGGIVDHGDGTYTATYTPSGPGTDQVAVTIVDPLTGGPTPVAGSPFTSEVGSVWVDVAAGQYHACGLGTDGRAYCWGDNSQGQLGTGGGSSGTPVPVATAERFVDVLAADSRSCGLTAGGELHCWGRNEVGQLGTGTWSMMEALPVRSGPGTLFQQVDLGNYHACGVTTAGAFVCWGGVGGSDPNRGLALGFTPPDACPHGTGVYLSESCSLSPRPSAPGLAVAEVSAGLFHTCVVTTGGDGYCWGLGTWGQLGNGDPPDQAQGSTGRADPQLVSGGRTWDRIEAGNVFTCGVDAGGGHCWGAWLGTVSGGLNAGQLGSGAPMDPGARFPTPVAGAPALSAVRPSLENHINAMSTCAVSAAGGVWCWGANDRGQLGTSDPLQTCSVFEITACTATPLLVAGLPPTADVVLGDRFACALSAGGRVHCWGANDVGQLGVGAGPDRPTPVEVAAPGTAVAAVAAIAGGARNPRIRRGGEPIP